MSVGLTAERAELADILGRFLAQKAPITEVRRLMGGAAGAERELWKRMSDQLALPATAIPEKFGGAGFGYAELAVVFEQTGRRLVPSPLFATSALAVPALLASGDEQALADLLPGIASGERTATLAWVEEDGDWSGGSRSTAVERGGTWHISGVKTYVVDGATADLIVVSAQTPSSPALFAVEGEAAGLERIPIPTFDQTRRLARLELSGTPARLLGTAGDGDKAVAAALDRAAVLLAAEMVGGAQACLDMSVEYAKQREQFGRPIGSFQAIKHKCAEVLVDLEGARAAAYFGAWAADASPAELPVVACVAKATASEAFFRAAAENVQIHGGIGATWEHDAHLYLKRAKTSGILLGDPALHRRRLAELIGL